jgi:hypothetical protein
MHYKMYKYTTQSSAYLILQSFVTFSSGDLAISLHSYTVPLVQWSTRLLPVMRDPCSIPIGILV